MRKVIVTLSLVTVFFFTLIFINYPQNKTSKSTFTVAHIKFSPVDDITFEGFRAGMAELGYIEGQQVTYLQHPLVKSIKQLDEIATDYASNKDIDLILSSSTPATLAVQRIAKVLGIPVVFAPVNDPIAAGIITDLKRPPANLTGIRLPVRDKIRFNFLLQLSPTVKVVLLPYNVNDKSSVLSLTSAEENAQLHKMMIKKVPVTNKLELNELLAGIGNNFDAIFLPRDSLVEGHINEFVAVAKKLKIPLSAPSSQQAEAGALFSYGHEHRKIGGQAARLVDQIFKGLSPSDLPVETAQAYLVINLKTAKAIDLDIPDYLLRQADVIIYE